MDNVLFSYDDIDFDNELSQQDPDSLKSCEACGKKFLPYGRNAKRMRFCNRQHYRSCPVCGKNYNIDLSVGINSIKKSCSRSCNNKLTMLTMSNTLMERYGVSNASQMSDHKDKVFQRIY